jgi:hypothetical protein
MNILYAKLGVSKRVIDDSKAGREPRKFTKFSDTAPPYANYNEMCDLIELPTAPFGFKYLFVIVDIAGNGHFDIEPLKTKTPNECLKALKTIFKRQYIHKPYFSIASDAGNEFLGSFEQFLDDNAIYHKIGVPNRKTQNSPVESLNRILVRFIFAYLNTKEIELKKTFKNWLPVVPIIREELNKIRAKEIRPLSLDSFKPLNLDKKNKFEEGDRVQYKLNTPSTFIGQKNIGGFREGDLRWSNPTVITKVLLFAGAQPYRYLVQASPRASYTEAQLRIVNG